MCVVFYIMFFTREDGNKVWNVEKNCIKCIPTHHQSIQPTIHPNHHPLTPIQQLLKKKNEKLFSMPFVHGHRAASGSSSNNNNNSKKINIK